MCLSVNPQPQLWPSRTGLTETRGSDGTQKGAGLFMALPGASPYEVRTVSTYDVQTLKHYS